MNRHPAFRIFLFLAALFAAALGGRYFDKPLLDVCSKCGVAERPAESNVSASAAPDKPADRLAAYTAQTPAQLRASARVLRTAPLAEQTLLAPALFAAWADSDPTGALLAASDFKILKDAIVSLVLDRWASSSPRDAADFYGKYEKSLFTRNYLSPWEQVSGSETVAAALAASDPQYAIQWAKERADLADRTEAVSGIFAQQTARSPQAALALLRQLSEADKESAIAAIAREWSKRDITGVANWMDQLKGDERTLALRPVIQGVAQTDPEAASWYLGYIPDNRDQAIGDIVRPWTELSPRAAADWLLGKTTLEEQRFFIEPLLQQWISDDRETAKDWALSYPRGPARDQALAAYARATSSGIESPLDLISLARAQIDNPEEKERTITDALVAWARKKPAEANALAESSGLSNRALASYYHQANAQIPLD